MKRILISVTDKEGIGKFEALTALGWEIISTGGTANALEKAGIPCTLIETVTGFPEMMDGRLKTLHPNIFGGILADRSKADHMQAILEHNIQPTDIVVVNLYKFKERPGIENIDIGGPSLLRAASKNGSSVTVVVDPNDYERIIQEVVKEGRTTPDTRELLAIKAFVHTSEYDNQIACWMKSERAEGRPIFGQPTAAKH